MTDTNASETQAVSTRIVHHDIGSPLVVIDSAAQVEIRNLCRQGRAMKVRDSATFERADILNSTMRGYIRKLETGRTALKRPVLELGRAIDEACKEIFAPLKDASERLSDELFGYQREQTRIAAAEQAERQRKLAEAAAVQAKAAEEAIVGDTRKARELVSQAQDLRQEVLRSPAAAPPKVASVSTRRIKSLVITEPDKIPARVTAPDGTVYRLLTPDRAAIRRAIEVGVDVPGATLEDVESIATKRMT